MNSGIFVPPIATTNNKADKIISLRNVDCWYAALALILVISSMLFAGLWAVDRFIIYNFLTLLMLSQAGRKISGRGQKHLKYLPMATFLYLFLSPQLLAGLFLVSHLVILFLVLLLTSRHQVDIAAVPLEALIMIHFLL